MACIDIPCTGGPEVMVRRTIRVPRPGPREVLIEVRAAGVNRADARQRLGLYPMPADAPTIPGLEVSGRVAAVGSRVRRWKIGDEVCALIVGAGYAEYCVAPEGQCLPVPPGVSLVDAASLPECAFTVWTALFERGRLRPGETLLIHGGASGIGTLATQWARAIGAHVIVTAGSPKKCRACLALGADAAIDYRRQDFAQRVPLLTQGRGVDVILDMVGEPYLERNLAVLARDGRLVYIAYLEGRKAAFDIQALMLKRVAITGTTLRHRTVAQKARIARVVERELWPLIAAGRVRPVVNRVFPLARAADAHRLLEGPANIGKLLLKP
jgi:NADPH2:quinone reductase